MIGPALAPEALAAPLLHALRLVPVAVLSPFLGGPLAPAPLRLLLAAGLGTAAWLLGGARPIAAEGMALAALAWRELALGAGLAVVVAAPLEAARAAGRLADTGARGHAGGAARGAPAAAGDGAGRPAGAAAGRAGSAGRRAPARGARPAVLLRGPPRRCALRRRARGRAGAARLVDGAHRRGGGGGPGGGRRPRRRAGGGGRAARRPRSPAPRADPAGARLARAAGHGAGRLGGRRAAGGRWWRWPGSSRRWLPGVARPEGPRERRPDRAGHAEATGRGQAARRGGDLARAERRGLAAGRPRRPRRLRAVVVRRPGRRGPRRPAGRGRGGAASGRRAPLRGAGDAAPRRSPGDWPPWPPPSPRAPCSPAGSAASRRWRRGWSGSIRSVAWPGSSPWRGSPPSGSACSRRRW